MVHVCVYVCLSVMVDNAKVEMPRWMEGVVGSVRFPESVCGCVCSFFFLILDQKVEAVRRELLAQIHGVVVNRQTDSHE